MESSLEAELGHLPKFYPNCCIYRVPRHLQMANEGAYTPLLVAIGPLHHYDDHLQPTELHKLKYLKSFLDRSGQGLGAYSQLIRSHEAAIRQSYADPMVGQIDVDQLVRMVLVDAAFLIELFSRGFDHKLIQDDDQTFNPPRMVVEVSQDIFLEENQLPFFILCELYNVAFKKKHRQKVPSFVKIACKFLHITTRSNPMPESPHAYKHILDLLRRDFLPSQPRVQSAKQPGKKNNYNVVYRSATTLHEAGVKFKVANGSNSQSTSSCRLLDIKFDPAKATMWIPRLVVQDNTEALFKNLTVFEQCHYFNDSYVIDYIAFMDFLINTEEDVALLVKHGIIENWLGSYERVVELFNGLHKHLKLRVEDFYYATQCNKLEEYYKKPWKHYRAVLRLCC